MAREEKIALKPLVADALVEGARGDAVVFGADGLLEEEVPVQRIERQGLGVTERDLARGVFDLSALYDEDVYK